jgi:hypothetical protein
MTIVKTDRQYDGFRIRATPILMVRTGICGIYGMVRLALCLASPCPPPWL